MDIRTVITNATPDELLAIASAIERAEAKPAVLVTLKNGKGTRRYVVAQEDEHMFEGLTDAASIEERFGHMGAILTAFGGQWLRSMGRVDEMYRTLSMGEVVKVTTAERARVWGR